MPTVLQNHTTPQSAYVVYSYPFGWDLRCQIRYWVETKAGGGKGKGQQRFASQTTQRAFNHLYTDKLNELRLKYMGNDEEAFDIKHVSEKYAPELLMPSDHQWNKPNYGTYFDIALLVLNEKNEVHCEALSRYSGFEMAKRFAENFGSQLDEGQQIMMEKIMRGYASRGYKV